MSNQRINEYDQPIGFDLPEWTIPETACVDVLEGEHIRLERLREEHTSDLFEAFSDAKDASAWTYLPYGPFATESDLRDWVVPFSVSEDPWMFALIDPASGKTCGVASYLRNNPGSGSIEVGHIHFSSLMTRSKAATEAMFLMADNAFKRGYRRYEWKCDNLNEPSRRAALRLGFVYEGVFRQATVYKKRNRDTAWFAITDKDWMKLRGVFTKWLSDSNFDGHGRQLQSLSGLTAGA